MALIRRSDVADAPTRGAHLSRSGPPSSLGRPNTIRPQRLRSRPYVSRPSAKPYAGADTVACMDSLALQTTEDSRAWDPAWPTADIVIVPGLPGKYSQSDDDRLQNPYPTTSTDIAKILRQDGLAVEYAVERSERQEVSLMGAEYWLPILFFALDCANRTPTEILLAAIERLFGSGLPSRSRLHVAFGQQRADGSVHYFEAHGKGSEVIEAIRAHGEANQAASTES